MGRNEVNADTQTFRPGSSRAVLHMTTVAIHQPQYLPWVPYMAKAAACDVFCYLDNVQYQKNGVQNRNQIKTASGPLWLSVPVNAALDTTIQFTHISDNRWQRKHIASIGQNYANSQNVELFRSGLQPLLEREWEFLADLNIAVTEWMFDQLDVTSKRVRASDLGCTGKADDLVIDICRKLGADIYLSGHGAKAYQSTENFDRAGIGLQYHVFEQRDYPQCFPRSGFVGGLSAVDLILNMGSRAKEFVRN